jgi:hypothetical protein
MKSDKWRIYTQMFSRKKGTARGLQCQDKSNMRTSGKQKKHWMSKKNNIPIAWANRGLSWEASELQAIPSLTMRQGLRNKSDPCQNTIFDHISSSSTERIL